jgi:S1-C subfamily serine protease
MGSTLRQFSDAIVETVNAAARGVVRVEGRDRLPSSGMVWDDNVIVTSSHGLERDEVRVGMEGDSVPARLLGRDAGVDVAVLRVTVAGWTPKPLTANGEPLVGAIVLAVGRPGPRVLASFGLLSAVDKGWRTPQGGFVDRYLQTDVVMFPGLSGGPLVDADGHVVGMATSGLVSGVSVAVPTSTLRATVSALVAHGRVRRGFLGVGAQPVELASALSKRAGQERALLVMSVDPHGPAGRSGLMLGDTLVTLNGQPVRSLEELLAALGEDVIGKKVAARVLRGGQLKELSVLVGERET